MAGFIGQKRVLEALNRLTLQTMPHALLLLGEAGCGKKTMAKYLANKLGVPLKAMDAADCDSLSECRQSPLKAIYLIDLNKFALEKEQNALLKFIEEPGDNAYAVLICDSDVGILPTVLNRCAKIRFEPYTAEQLRQVKRFGDELAYRVCRTPGQLNGIDEAGLQSLKALCRGMLSSGYERLLGVAAKINYKDDYRKFDFNAFFNMLEAVTLDEFTARGSAVAMKAYLYTARRKRELAQNALMAKEPFMINFLIGLYEELRK